VTLVGVEPAARVDARQPQQRGGDRDAEQGDPVEAGQFAVERRGGPPFV
jgi:hypothetical protein